MGHYVAARYHRVKVTLPYFIPLPIPGSLGTLGATIFIRSPLQTRRVLFNGGSAAPWRVAVALPLLSSAAAAADRVRAPITMSFVGGHAAFAGWLGKSGCPEGSLSRAFSAPSGGAGACSASAHGAQLLPLGQFDGGHVLSDGGTAGLGLAGGTFFALALGLMCLADLADLGFLATCPACATRSRMTTLPRRTPGARSWVLTCWFLP
jgi:membrane-associated protease RseP (regulator of RpoE activity)